MQLTQILAPIAVDMRRVDQLIRTRLTSEVALINEIGDYIVSAGGKRLRPAILLLVARALGAGDETAPLLAVVIELIHTATLLHDDVVDHADLRRGQRTANAVWGNAGAVLSGDFLYSRSFQLMVEANRSTVMRIMADATNAIAEGEVLQLMNSHDPDVTQARYLRVIELKTARLFEAAAALGAVCADAPPAQVSQMRAFGSALGMAYQLIDDLLDYTADPKISGKQIGSDLAEGKPTLPLIHALTHSEAATRERLCEVIREGHAERIEEVLRAVEATGAIPYTRRLANRYCETAIAALDGLPNSTFAATLRELTMFTEQRIA
ncbi:MAG: polyprenyl synthetase family protein [Gammaproteobacteria bacterium]|nr:polyprenyl synthetase family protein [Gammaproteobacteria bacterium]